MKITRFGAFTLGVLITAFSVGLVTYASAAGDTTIKACANKKSGAMRHISKGSCRKTETSLAWNQMESQVTQETEVSNAPLISEAYGDGSVYDSAGQYIGQIVSVLDGAWYDEYKIARGAVYFHLGSNGGVYGEVMFSGANCTGTPFTYIGLDRQWPTQLSTTEAVLTLAPGSRSVQWYRPNSGSLQLLTPASVLSDSYAGDHDDWIDRVDGIGNCTNLTGKPAGLHRTVELISPLVQITTNSPLRLNP